LIVAEARRILESIGSEQAVVPDNIIDQEIEKLLQAINTEAAGPVIEAAPDLSDELTRGGNICAAAFLY
jgi:hypothetical protein